MLFYRGHIYYMTACMYVLMESFTCKYRIKVKSYNYRLTLYP